MTADPRDTNPMLHPQRHPPIARVMSATSAIFSMHGINVVGEADNPDYVRDETLYGIKTFNSPPLAPTLHPADMTQKVANAQWTQNQILSMVQRINGGAF